MQKDRGQREEQQCERERAPETELERHTQCDIERHTQRERQDIEKM